MENNKKRKVYDLKDIWKKGLAEAELSIKQLNEKKDKLSDKIVDLEISKSNFNKFCENQALNDVGDDVYLTVKFRKEHRRHEFEVLRQEYISSIEADQSHLMAKIDEIDSEIAQLKKTKANYEKRLESSKNTPNSTQTRSNEK